MPRKATLELKASRIRTKRSNGDVYIYERTTKYNPDKKFNEVISSHLVGKIPAGMTQMVSTRPRRNKQPSIQTAISHRVGITDILEWIGRESGIDQDLYRSTDKATAEKIISIARYWAANPGKTLPYIEEWQISHEVPYTDGMSHDSCYLLMKTIGTDAQLSQKFFNFRAARTPSKGSIAFDSSTISSHSENQIEARYGCKTVKLLTQYCLETRQPIAYSRQPGNIPDVVSVINACEQLPVFHLDKPVLVMDAGFFSEDNFLQLIHRHIKFLAAGKTDVKWIQLEFEKALGSIQQLSNSCPFDAGIYGTTAMAAHKFPRTRERGRGSATKGGVILEEHRIYLHLFLNNAKAEAEKAALTYEIKKVRDRLLSGVEFLSKGEKHMADQYLTVRNTRGGMSVSYRDDVFHEAVRFAGCFVLVSNTPLDTFDALSMYRRREKVEESFRMEKQYIDGNRTRAWYPESLNGRLFCQFVTLCYHEYLHKAISDLKRRLSVRNGDPKHDSKKNLQDEKGLLGWLEDMSIERLFAWFDCIEETSVNTNMGRHRWRTETISRDQMFLRKLGVIK